MGFSLNALGRAAVCAVLLFCAGPVSAEKPAVRAAKPSYLSPLAEMKNRRAGIIHLNDLRSALLESLAGSRSLDQVAVYVEDLNSGIWVGIGERERVRTASLLKVVTAMSWLKWEQDQKSILDRPIRIGAEDLVPNDMLAAAIDTPIRPGEYRVMNLIQSALIRSDNTAHRALLRVLPKFRLIETFTDIGLPDPFDRSDTAAVYGLMSAKQYSYVIKSLYNASYLDPVYSEQILRLLVRSEFGRGIRSVVGSRVEAALKYGIWTESSAVYECGIVYLKDAPYLICIFTFNTGQDYEKNLSLIRQVASIVHPFLQAAARP